MKEYFKAIPAVFAVFKRDGRVLMIRRFRTSYADGQYSLPAGHVEPDESLRQALIRETKEEVGIDLEESSTRLVHTVSVNADDGHRLNFFFEIRDWKGEPTNKEPEKCDHMDWFDLEHLPKETIPYVAHVLHHIQDGVTYSEEWWPGV